MAWATTANVETITGTTVTSAQLNAAQAVVELFVGVTPDADDAATTRDLHWLKQAVAWQSVWQKDQPGFSTRSSVEGGDQDGARWTYTSKAAVNLAPLAIRAIKNLSWMGNRSVAVSLPATAPLAFNVETSDAYHDWVPL